MGLLRKTQKNVALNPVARALAKKQLASEIVTNRIAIYMMDNGESCGDKTLVMSLPIYAVLVCLENHQENSVDVRMLKSACAVLQQIAESGFVWRKEFAVTLDNALQICERRWAGIPAKELNQVIKELSSV